MIVIWKSETGVSKNLGKRHGQYTGRLATGIAAAQRSTAGRGLVSQHQKCLSGLMPGGMIHRDLINVSVLHLETVGRDPWIISPRRAVGVQAVP